MRAPVFPLGFLAGSLIVLLPWPTSVAAQEIVSRTDVVEVVLDAKALRDEIFFIGETEKKLEGKTTVRLVSRSRTARPVRLHTIMLSPRGEIVGRCASDIVELVPGRLEPVRSLCRDGTLRLPDPETAVAGGDVMSLELEPGESVVRAASEVFMKIEWAGAVAIQAVPADRTTIQNKAVLLSLKYPIEHG